jgi:hypothetical protein
MSTQRKIDMREYTPDMWVMLKITHNGKPIHKILASWGGSYLYGQSWKLNSGVTKIEEDGQCYLFHGSSGSVYRCHKNGYGMTGYTHGVLASFQKQAEETEGLELEMLPEETNFMGIDYE